MPSPSKHFTKFFLSLLGYTSQRKYLDPVTDVIATALGKLAIRTRGVGTAQDVAMLGTMWQRAFGGDKHHPVTKTEKDTVYAEIHTHCPLRGSGDVHACYKMMQFDRTIADHAGGQFVVLESQSNSGKTFCKVAMRMKGKSVDDLKEAHRSQLDKF